MSVSAAKSPVNEKKSLEQSFRDISEELSRLGSEYGVQIIPYRDKSLPIFSVQSFDKQQHIIQDLETYVRICHDTIDRGYDPKDSSQLLWTALKDFKLRPPADLFSFIRSDNVVEIHNQQLVQIFRTFNFYDFCSYSIEELYCSSWPELYRRDAAIELQLIGVVAAVFGGKLTTTTAVQVDEHIIEEISSPSHFKIKARVRYGAPLFEEDTNVVAATIAIEEGELLNPQSRLQPLRSVETSSPKMNQLS